MNTPCCFYCGEEIEQSGTTKIITANQTYEFENWECHPCNLRYLIEKMEKEQ